MIQGDNPYFVQCDGCDAVATDAGSPEIAEYMAWIAEDFTVCYDDAKGSQHFCPACAEKRKETKC